jgi:hypothetical protein
MEAPMTTRRIITTADCEILAAIAARAENLSAFYGDKIARSTIFVDLDIYLSRGGRLRLTDLLNADSGNFGHDVFGIHRFLDRKTGKLGNCFLPRFTERKAVTS